MYRARLLFLHPVDPQHCGVIPPGITDAVQSTGWRHVTGSPPTVHIWKSHRCGPNTVSPKSTVTEPK